MRKRSLRHFDPIRIAHLDMRMWKAYYRHQFIQLFFLLARLAREFFCTSYIHALRAAWYAADAAIDFRVHKGKENEERILRKLIPLFRLVSENSIEGFDYKKAASLELKWWFVDRYPERYDISREQALMEAIASMHTGDPERFKEYAQLRAEAMTLQDRAERGEGPADWQQIRMLLERSFTALHTAVQ